MTNTPYELVKELKDAGFPQGDTLYYYGWAGDAGPDFVLHRDDERIVKDNTKSSLYAIPTLEEVIAECGEEFVGLDRTDNGWQAVGNLPNSIKEGNKTTTFNCFVKEIGKTPLEAAIRLYIAIKKV